MVDNIKTIKFGKYFQGAKIFGKEFKTPIEWYVLDSVDNRSLLLSKYILELKPYNNKFEEITWEQSSIRKWLNNEKDINNSFIMNAFSDEERKRILEIKLQNNGYKEFNVDGGNDTLDKVFLLSIHEFNKYLKDSKIVLAAPTKKLFENFKLFVSEEYKTNYGKNVTFWMLRTLGYTNKIVTVVAPNGELHPYGAKVHISFDGVRVALWVMSN